MAFATLARRHQADLLRVAGRFVPTAEDAEDIVQDALVAAWRGLPGFRGDSALDTWLTRITINKALKLARRRRIEQDYAATATGPETSDPDHAGDLAVRTSVARLPEKLRAPVVLRFWEGMTGTEIAEVLGWKQATVWTRLYRGLELLRRELAEEAPR